MLMSGKRRDVDGNGWLNLDQRLRKNREIKKQTNDDNFSCELLVWVVQAAQPSYLHLLHTIKAMERRREPEGGAMEEVS
jgi:hypothetical protein